MLKHASEAQREQKHWDHPGWVGEIKREFLDRTQSERPGHHGVQVGTCCESVQIFLKDVIFPMENGAVISGEGGFSYETADAWEWLTPFFSSSFLCVSSQNLISLKLYRLEKRGDWLNSNLS